MRVMVARKKEDNPVPQLTSPVEIYWISGSPFSWRVLLTAEVKGIPYEGKLLEASKGEHKTPERRFGPSLVRHQTAD